MNIGIFSPGAYCVLFNELILHSNKNNFTIDNEKVNWHILTNTNIYLNHFEKTVSEENICYLFQNFNKMMEDNNLDIDLSNYHGSIYKDILTDKHSFFTKDSNYQIKNASVTYKIWKNYLIKSRLNYIVFPDIEYVEGMILLALCRELDIKVLYYVHARNIGEALFAKNNNEEYYLIKDSKKVGLMDFISKHKNNLSKAYNVSIDFNQKRYNCIVPKYKRKFLDKLVTYLKNKLIYEKHYLKEDMSFIIKFRSLFLNLLNKYRSSRKLIYEKYVTVKNLKSVKYKFIYFPLQITPESSINNLEPYFVDQLRAIDLLVMNIDSNIKVVVKEHPAFVGEREESFYKKLANKPGVEIASLQLSSKELLNDSIMVSSITGTVCLEAMLQNKPLFQFGKTFFYQDSFGFDSFHNMNTDLLEIISGKRNNNIDKILEDLYPVLFNFYIELPMQYYYQPKPIALMEENLNNTLKAIDFYITNIENGNMK